MNPIKDRIGSLDFISAMQSLVLRWQRLTTLVLRVIKFDLAKTALSALVAFSCATSVHGKTIDDDDLLQFIPAILGSLAPQQQNGVLNGWFVRADGSVIWGYASHNSWWDSQATMPNLSRNAGS